MPEPHISPVGPLKAWLDLPLEDRVMALVEDPSLLELVRDLIDEVEVVNAQSDAWQTEAARLEEQLESRERELFGTGTALANADRVAAELTKRIAELKEQHQTARDALVKIAEGPSDTSPPEIARCALGWPAHGWESGIYEQYEGVCRERDEFIASYEHEITGLQEQLEAYREFYAAWWEVEKGVSDFDLHPEAVTRLSEAHAAVIRLDSSPASGERVAAGLPSSTSETSGANQSPEDSSPAFVRCTDCPYDLCDQGQRCLKASSPAKERS